MLLYFEFDEFHSEEVLSIKSLFIKLAITSKNFPSIKISMDISKSILQREIKDSDSNKVFDELVKEVNRNE